MPTTNESLQRLLVALLVGLLIGVDRERAEERKARKQFAGIRTFALIALVGAALALVHTQTGPWPLVLSLGAVASLALVSYRASVGAGQIGATTEIAALATFVLGTLAELGQMRVAGAIGVVVAVLLVSKPRLERFSRAISPAELTAALELAVISAIVLPLLPDQGYGPWQVLNPFRIWLVVVMVSAVSFAGFVAMRWQGEATGTLLAAALGGLASSTATTVAMAARSRAEPHPGRTISAAAVLATTMAFARVAVLVGAVGPRLLLGVAPALAAMVATGVVATLILRRGGPSDEGKVARPPVANPFRLRSALLFGAMFAATTLLVRAGRELLGTEGTWLAAGLSGLADVDAVALALARGTTDDGRAHAALGVIIALASNNLFKSGIAVLNGAGRFRREVPMALAAVSAVGISVAIVTARLI